jgi:hypothetical protein
VYVEEFGGTDFRPAFEHVDHEQINAACLICLTDSDGVYPDEPSTYPTRWAITTMNRQAPWGLRCTSRSQVNNIHPPTQGAATSLEGILGKPDRNHSQRFCGLVTHRTTGTLSPFWGDHLFRILSGMVLSAPGKEWQIYLFRFAAVADGSE